MFTRRAFQVAAAALATTLATALATALVTPLAAAPAAAQPATVRADHAWCRATPPGASIGVLFLTLTSPSADRLVGVSSPAAARAELHAMTMEGPVMRMRELPDGLALPAGQPVTLAPSGVHVMLTGLVAPLRRGQRIQVRLVFASSPPVDVEAIVASVGASAPPPQP